MVVDVRCSHYDVYIGRGRGGVWGNPFIIGKDGDRAVVIAKFRSWLIDQLLNDPGLLTHMRNELRGKVLGCWCNGQSCHGDVLVEFVNDDGLLETLETLEVWGR